jgi:hypothetical protein
VRATRACAVVAAPPQAADIKQVLQCVLEPLKSRLMRLPRAWTSSPELCGFMQILETLVEGRNLTELQTQEAMEVFLLHRPLCLKE